MNSQSNQVTSIKPLISHEWSQYQSMNHYPELSVSQKLDWFSHLRDVNSSPTCWCIGTHDARLVSHVSPIYLLTCLPLSDALAAWQTVFIHVFVLTCYPQKNVNLKCLPKYFSACLGSTLVDLYTIMPYYAILYHYSTTWHRLCHKDLTLDLFPVVVNHELYHKNKNHHLVW